jgi:hypothetical protein
MFTGVKVLQMNLCEMFAKASSSRSVNVNSLEEEKSYSVIGPERVQNKYRKSILLARKASSADAVRVFLPKRFILIFSDVDVNRNNGGMIKINLDYHRICEKTNACQLSLELVQENEKPHLNMRVIGF